MLVSEAADAAHALDASRATAIIRLLYVLIVFKTVTKVLIIAQLSKLPGCPCTFRAKVREATGKEAYEITGLSDACRMLYYQVRATAEADGREFDMDFRTFALRVTPEDIQRWGEAVNDENAKGSKKKMTAKK